MKFNENFQIKGKHAFLSPSKYHWVNYDREKLKNAFYKAKARERGTELHEYAAKSIELGVKLARSNATLNRYVNDAIGFNMTAEVPLFYSKHCFGHADALGFRKNLLRIHDYKSGESPCSMTQLKIYAAIFCLEYAYNPNDIDIELRIYQSDDVEIEIPEKEEILFIMARVIDHSKFLDEEERK